MATVVNIPNGMFIRNSPRESTTIEVEKNSTKINEVVKIRVEGMYSGHINDVIEINSSHSPFLSVPMNYLSFLRILPKVLRS